jgi:hypothetical protein
MAARKPGLALAAAVRATAAVAGGYGVTALAVQALASGLARWGMSPSEAVASAALLGFPAYLALLLWALACPGLSRLVWTLGLAAAALAGAGWLLAGARS